MSPVRFESALVEVLVILGVALAAAYLILEVTV